MIPEREEDIIQKTKQDLINKINKELRSKHKNPDYNRLQTGKFKNSIGRSQEFRHEGSIGAESQHATEISTSILSIYGEVGPPTSDN